MLFSLLLKSQLWGTAPTVLAILCIRCSAFLICFHSKTMIIPLWFGNAKIKCVFFQVRHLLFLAVHAKPTKQKTQPKSKQPRTNPARCFAKALIKKKPNMWQWDAELSSCLINANSNSQTYLQAVLGLSHLGMLIYISWHLHLPGKMFIVVTKKENQHFFRQSQGSAMKYASVRAKTQEFCTFFSPALLDLIFEEVTCCKQSFSWVGYARPSSLVDANKEVFILKPASQDTWINL